MVVEGVVAKVEVGLAAGQSRVRQQLGDVEVLLYQM
jgi:hypothetical protein